MRRRPTDEASGSYYISLACPLCGQHIPPTRFNVGLALRVRDSRFNKVPAGIKCTCREQNCSDQRAANTSKKAKCQVAHSAQEYSRLGNRCLFNRTTTAAGLPNKKEQVDGPLRKTVDRTISWHIAAIQSLHYRPSKRWKLLLPAGPTVTFNINCVAADL